MSAKPNVHIVATGGTIAGTRSPAGGYVAGQLGVQSLIDAVPRLCDVAHVSGEQLATIGSQDMDDATWLRLSRRLNQLAGDSAVDGVVVTHGTDTLEETAWFADLTVRPSKPIVFTGAMRTADAADADGPGNILAAVATAGDQKAAGHGVLVVMAGAIFTAREAAKFDTHRLDAFSWPDISPLGHIEHGRPILSSPADAPPVRFDIESLATLPNVPILYAHAGMTPDLINAAAHADGLVLAGMGSGNLPVPVITALANLARTGTAIVRATRVPSGPVTGGGEIDDSASGFVHANHLSPAKSRVLLQLALSTTSDRSAIQQLFDTHGKPAAHLR